MAPMPTLAEPTPFEPERPIDPAEEPPGPVPDPERPVDPVVVPDGPVPDPERPVPIEPVED